MQYMALYPNFQIIRTFMGVKEAMDVNGMGRLVVMMILMLITPMLIVVQTSDRLLSSSLHPQPPSLLPPSASPINYAHLSPHQSDALQSKKLPQALSCHKRCHPQSTTGEHSKWNCSTVCHKISKPKCTQVCFPQSTTGGHRKWKCCPVCGPPALPDPE